MPTNLCSVEAYIKRKQAAERKRQIGRYQALLGRFNAKHCKYFPKQV